jgi:hypothetical protein
MHLGPSNGLSSLYRDPEQRYGRSMLVPHHNSRVVPQSTFQNWTPYNSPAKPID